MRRRSRFRFARPVQFYAVVPLRWEGPRNTGRNQSRAPERCPAAQAAAASLQQSHPCFGADGDRLHDGAEDGDGAHKQKREAREIRPCGLSPGRATQLLEFVAARRAQRAAVVFGRARIEDTRDKQDRRYFGNETEGGRNISLFCIRLRALTQAVVNGASRLFVPEKSPRRGRRAWRKERAGRRRRRC